MGGGLVSSAMQRPPPSSNSNANPIEKMHPPVIGPSRTSRCCAMSSGRARMRPFVVKMEDTAGGGGQVKTEDDANAEQPRHRRRLNEGRADLPHDMQSLRAHAEAQAEEIQSMKRELQHANERIAALTAEAKVKGNAPQFKSEPVLASIGPLQRKDADVCRVHAESSQSNAASAAVGDALQAAPVRAGGAGGGAGGAGAGEADADADADAAAEPYNGAGEYTWDDGSMYIM